MGRVLSSHRPQTGTAPLIEVGYLCLSVHMSYRGVRPWARYLNPGVFTVLGHAEEFATYFLRVLK